MIFIAKEPFIFCLKEGSIKAIVLEIFRTEHPLTINNIHQKVKEISRQDIKYHTVYETIKNLEQQKILKKKGPVYLINYDWILKNKDYINNLQLNYAKNLKKDPLFFDSIDIANAQIINFNSLEKFDEALKDFEDEFITNTKKNEENTIIWRTKHSWWCLLYMTEQLDQIKKLKEFNIKSYFYIEGKTPLDKWVQSLYQKHGIKVKIGCEKAMDSIFGIYNDKLLFVVYPYELIKAIDFIFSENIDVQDVDIAGFFKKYFKKKMFISLIVAEHKAIAEKYRKYLLFKI